MLHLDVMDGHFVPNITFGPCVIKGIRNLTDMVFDAHLMISRPWEYVDDFVECGSDIITVHRESFTTIGSMENTLQAIKEAGARAGISINPGTPFEEVTDVLGYADLLLVMTVKPGFGGQSFMEEVVPKIKQASEYIRKNHPKIELSVDGGISPKTAPAVVRAGADILVAGSAIFKGDPAVNMLKLRRASEL